MVIQAPPFFWATLALFILTLIFYLVWVSIFYYWHEKKASFVVPPLLFAFEFFITGFFVVALVSLLWQYFPQIITLLK